ncbi:hypothetical protein DFH09DRAFT_1080697 [Mycena vulgaris]|nr:hypothetical protein DFH09DRAFT_1080697 [Mycena vulgaris]
MYHMVKIQLDILPQCLALALGFGVGFPRKIIPNTKEILEHGLQMVGLYQMVSSLERVAVEKQNIEILVQIGAGRETECVNPPSRGFRGGFNVDKSWLYGDGVAWYILAVVDDLLCRPLQGSHYCTTMCLRRKVCTGTLGGEWGKTLAQELTGYWLKWVVLLYLFRLYTAFSPRRTIDLP